MTPGCRTQATKKKKNQQNNLNEVIRFDYQPTVVVCPLPSLPHARMWVSGFYGHLRMRLST